MNRDSMGKRYADGEIIVRQGDRGDCMFVIQRGRVEVVQSRDGKETTLAVLEDGDFFGEMALFEKEVRSATVRAKGEVWALTVDKKTFLRRIHADPSLAFRILETMCHRVRELDSALSRLSGEAD